MRVWHEKLLPISFLLLVATLLCLSLGGCFVNSGDDGGGGVSPPSPIYPQPYAEPSVSPDGNKLLFVRNKVTSIRPGGGFSINSDSSGIWMADSDGQNMKLLIQSRNVGSPSFSPDMQWILFEGGGQIYKVPFTSDSVVMDSLLQLTTEGRNFFPSWSPDGQWIAYNQSICNEIKECGIWLYDLETESHSNISMFGNYPNWHPKNDIILYQTSAVKPGGEVIGDSLWTYSLVDSTISFLTFLEGDNCYPKYSPGGGQIAIHSGLQIWVIQADGSSSKKIHRKGTQPVWDTNGKIVFVNFDPHRFSKDNGTIWMMNANGNNKIQVTFNHGLKLE